MAARGLRFLDEDSEASLCRQHPFLWWRRRPGQSAAGASSREACLATYIQSGLLWRLPLICNYFLPSCVVTLHCPE
jgi:hypothetical protein